jgi:hypothetical protein
MSKNLEDFRCEDEEPNSNDAEKARFESVVALGSLLKNISVFVAEP